MDAGTEILQLILSFFNVVVTAAAAFFGAWLTYIFQQRKEREQFESRLIGNINLLEDELDWVVKKLQNLPKVLEAVRTQCLISTGFVVPAFLFPKESLLQAKYDITFLSHRAALTGPLGDVIALLDNLAASVESLGPSLSKRSPEVPAAAFLDSRKMAFTLPLKQAETALAHIAKIREELQKMRAEMKDHRKDFF